MSLVDFRSGIGEQRMPLRRRRPARLPCPPAWCRPPARTGGTRHRTMWPPCRRASPLNAGLLRRAFLPRRQVRPRAGGGRCGWRTARCRRRWWWGGEWGEWGEWGWGGRPLRSGGAMACSRGWRDAGQRLLATRGSGTRGHRSFLRASPERRGNHTPLPRPVGKPARRAVSIRECCDAVGFLPLGPKPHSDRNLRTCFRTRAAVSCSPGSQGQTGPFSQATTERQHDTVRPRDPGRNVRTELFAHAAAGGRVCRKYGEQPWISP